MPGDAYLYADFPSGAVSNRVISSLSDLPYSKLNWLVQQRKIVSTPKDVAAMPFGMTYHNLRWNCLDDYAAACDVPVSFFLFPDGVPEKTYFSHFDQIVKPVIRAMPDEFAAAATEVLRAVYNNPRFRIPRDMVPSTKLVTLMFINNALPPYAPDEELYQYQNDINSEIGRFRGLRVKEWAKFHIDIMIDMCCYCKVSPHWAFSLNGPLLFNTVAQENLFSAFCLLSKSQQISAMSMLRYLCDDPAVDIPQEDLIALDILSGSEGGAASCL